MFHALRNSSKILFRSLYCSEILGSGVSFCSRAKVLVSSLLSKRLDGFNRQPSNVLNFNRQPFFDCQLSERSLVFTLKRFRDLSEVIIVNELQTGKPVTSFLIAQIKEGIAV